MYFLALPSLQFSYFLYLFVLPYMFQYRRH